MLSPMDIPVTRRGYEQAHFTCATLPVLSTQRLTLRGPTLDDFVVYAGIACSERSKHFGGPMTRETAWVDFAQMCATWVLRGHGLWTVTRENVPMGFVLIGTEQGDAAHELGFIFTEEGEGQGYASEAARAGLEYARDTLHLPELVSYIGVANNRAIAVAERLGAKHRGSLRGARVYRYWGPRG
jgi:RimJ/RimL family protein N-acetyltransferase